MCTIFYFYKVVKLKSAWSVINPRRVYYALCCNHITAADGKDLVVITLIFFFSILSDYVPEFVRDDCTLFVFQYRFVWPQPRVLAVILIHLLPKSRICAFFKLSNFQVISRAEMNIQSAYDSFIYGVFV